MRSRFKLTIFLLVLLASAGLRSVIDALPTRPATGTQTLIATHIPTRTAIVNPSPTPAASARNSAGIQDSAAGAITLSGVAVQAPMAHSSILVFSVNPVDGSNGELLGLTQTDGKGAFSIMVQPPPGHPLRLSASGGSFASEMNGVLVSQPSEISVLIAGAGSSIAGISINPVADFVNALTVGKLRTPGVTFAEAYRSAIATIDNLYALGGDPARILPHYAPPGTDAANLGLILGGLINEDQSLCPGAPGGLVAALSRDIADGVFDGRYFGAPVAYCGAYLNAIAGTAEFLDALSGLMELALVPRAFAFGGTANRLTVNRITNLAAGGNQNYPLGPLAAIASGVVKGAPRAQNLFAPPGATAQMKVARQAAAAALLPNGKVLIAGGLDAGDNPMASVELYDPSTNLFAAHPPSMNEARANVTMTVLPNGKVLIAGGQSFGLNASLASTELYDPAANTFAPPASTATMNVARTFATATLLPNGKVLIAGGEQGRLMESATTELYDPSTNSFAPPVATATMNRLHAFATATLLPDGKVLIAGGIDNSLSPKTELYYPASNSFSPLPPAMNTMRQFNPIAILLPNAKVLIAGGANSKYGPLASTELFDPVTGTFAPPAATATMNMARDLAAAVLLPNGKVLIAGGESSRGSSVEIYDPFTNSFAANAAPMNVNRITPTATLLPNGKVLIAGGFNPSTGQVLSSTDLYTP